LALHVSGSAIDPGARPVALLKFGSVGLGFCRSF
jgi:hypothetical protein